MEPKKSEVNQSVSVLSEASVAAFLSANVVIDTEARAAAAELYAHYAAWFPDLPDAGLKATRRAFTVNVQRVLKSFAQVRYGPVRFGADVARGFTGLRPALPTDNRLDDTPAGPLATARDLLTQSAARRPNDTAYVRDVRTVQDLLLTVDSMQWSRTVALNVLDEYAEIYPELDTVLALIHT